MITQHVATWIDATDTPLIRTYDEVGVTVLGIGHGSVMHADYASIKGTPAERRDFLARLILAAQAEVDRLDVAAAEPNGRAVAS